MGIRLDKGIAKDKFEGALDFTHLEISPKNRQSPALRGSETGWAIGLGSSPCQLLKNLVTIPMGHLFCKWI